MTTEVFLVLMKARRGSLIQQINEMPTNLDTYERDVGVAIARLDEVQKAITFALEQQTAPDVRF